MKFQKKSLFLFFILLFTSLIPIFTALKLYKPVLSVFPGFSELEIQFYYLVAISIVGIYATVFWLSYVYFIKDIFLKMKENVVIKGYILALFALLEACSMIFFAKYFFTEGFQKNLFDLGIKPDDGIALLILFLTSFLLTAFFYLIVINKNKRVGLIYSLASIVIIILLSFNVTNLNGYDYSYFAGPINDVIHGKVLLNNIRSQYGFLSIFFLSLPFNFIHLSLINLTILNAIAVSLGFILIFILLNFIFSNKYFSLFTIMTIIFTNFIIQISSRGDYPQTGFLRFGLWIIFCLMLLLKMITKKNVKKIELILLSLLTISFFWIIDNGFYILLSYLLFLFYIHLDGSIIKTGKRLIPEYTKIFLSISFGYLIINFIYTFILKVPIKWNYFFSDSQYYIAGFGLMPLPNSFIPWIVMITYLLAFTYFIAVRRFREPDIKEKIVFFVLSYGVFQFTYFMGRSHLNNLHHVSIPFLICLFFLIDKFFFKLKESQSKLLIFFGALSIGLFIGLPYYFIILQSPLNFRYSNTATTLKFISDTKISENKYFEGLIDEKTIPEIKIKYGSYINNFGISLVSVHDTWYLIELQKTNRVGSNNLNYYLEPSDWKNLANDILENKDRYVFFDRDKTKEKGQVKYIYQEIKDYYKFNENIGSLDIYERI